MMVSDLVSDLFSGWWVFLVYWIFASSYKPGSFMAYASFFWMVYSLFSFFLLPLDVHE